MKTSRRVTVHHISIVWLSQVLTMGFQLVYAGFTSRAVDPDGFGAFAVALAVTSLGGMVASAGLANAAARRTSEDVKGDRALVTAAAGIGLVVAICFFVTAPLWARLWGNPEAADLIRILSVGLVATSYSNALGGVARRLGSMRAWAAAALCSSLTGMLLGGVSAYLTRMPWSLTVMPVTASLMLSIILALSVAPRSLPTTQLQDVGSDMAYGTKSLGVTLMTYLAYSLPTWTMSRWLGASTFGSWNRAVAVGQVPLESAARAVQTVIFPKFRWDSVGGESVRARWSNLLASTGVVVLPLTALAIPIAPTATRLLLGSQWTESGQMAQFVLGATGVNVLASQLNTAFQASNNFRAVWVAQVTTIVIMACSAAAVFGTRTWEPMAVGYVLAAVTSLLAQAMSGVRTGRLDASLLQRWLAISAGLSALLAGAAFLCLLLFSSPLLVVAASVAMGGLYIGVLFALRNHIRPIAHLVAAT